MISPAMPVTDATRPTLHTDVLVVGGGVNGAGLARDLAGRGLRVLLCERDDLAGHTSSASTKLIHGGLRYLEYGEFALVRKALREREVLLRSAPHLMWPLQFVLPQAPGMRPAWMVRAGLWLYDHLARRQWLPASGAIDLRRHVAGAALQSACVSGFVYTDGWVDDARLVALCAVDARERGAIVLTRTACVAAQRTPQGWVATLRGSGGEQTVHARALVNAAGPWAESFLHQAVRDAQGRPLRERQSLRLVRGSHIVLPRLYDHPHPYLLQASDGRVVFVIPYEQRFTLIGTTEVEVAAPDGAEVCSDAEVEYLCAQVNRYLREPVRPQQVVWRYAGIRPLLEDHAGDPKAATRDYRLELDAEGPPLLTVWGGKITTFRVLAEQAADALCARLGHCSGAWTHDAPLPGGDLRDWIGAPSRPDADFARFVAALRQRHPWLPTELAMRWARAYGSWVRLLLQDRHQLADLGDAVLPGLYAAEIDYLREREWAQTAEDILWRRSKLGLHLPPSAAATLQQWLQAHPPTR